MLVIVKLEEVEGPCTSQKEDNGKAIKFWCTSHASVASECLEVRLTGTLSMYLLINYCSKRVNCVKIKPWGSPHMVSNLLLE